VFVNKKISFYGKTTHLLITEMKNVLEKGMSCWHLVSPLLQQLWLPLHSFSWNGVLFSEPHVPRGPLQWAYTRFFFSYSPADHCISDVEFERPRNLSPPVDSWRHPDSIDESSREAPTSTSPQRSPHAGENPLGIYEILGDSRAESARSQCTPNPSTGWNRCPYDPWT